MCRSLAIADVLTMLSTSRIPSSFRAAKRLSSHANKTSHMNLTSSRRLISSANSHTLRNSSLKLPVPLHSQRRPLRRDTPSSSSARRLLSSSSANSSLPKFNEESDYVIVGAGSAGCVLANRLSDPSAATTPHNVTLLEYGGSDLSVFIQMPTALSIPLNMPKYDWEMYSEPEPMLNNRRIHQARGKVLGGSSSINGMVYVRGNAWDFEEWNDVSGVKDGSGHLSWGYKDVLPYFKRAENCTYGDDTYRGRKGPLGVTNGNNMENPLYEAFVKAGNEAGYGESKDVNGEVQEGFGRMDMTVKDGIRQSAHNVYVRGVKSRQNLSVKSRTLASKIIFDGKKAVGVEYHVYNSLGKPTGEVRRIRAKKEVIVSASAFNSPKLLMLSGVGPGEHLSKLGIPVLHDLPGVGSNLQDHLEVWVQQACTQPITLNGWLSYVRKAQIGLQWLLTRKGLGGTNHFESNGYIRSRAGLRFPDIQYHFLAGAIAYDGSSASDGHGYQVHLGANKPKSRGTVRLKATDALTAPEIRFNYFSDKNDEDRQAFRDGLRLTREILAQPALDAYRGEEIAPGLNVDSEEEMNQWLAESSETAYHPCGSCCMGVDPNPSDSSRPAAVVDPELRVHGVESLRVVDSSIMPTATNGNLNAPTIMIAERAADIILGKELMLPADVPIFSPDEWETRQRTGSPKRSLSSA